MFGYPERKLSTRVRRTLWLIAAFPLAAVALITTAAPGASADPVTHTCQASLREAYGPRVVYSPVLHKVIVFPGVGPSCQAGPANYVQTFGNSTLVFRWAFTASAASGPAGGQALMHGTVCYIGAGCTDVSHLLGAANCVTAAGPGPASCSNGTDGSLSISGPAFVSLSMTCPWYARPGTKSIDARITCSLTTDLQNRPS